MSERGISPLFQIARDRDPRWPEYRRVQQIFPLIGGKHLAGDLLRNRPISQVAFSFAAFGNQGIGLCGEFDRATGLTACGGERVVIIKPPAALTSCADEPAAPDLNPVDWSSVEAAKPVQRERDQATLAYLLALRSAWGDCAAKIAGVKEWAKGLE